jgi:hypothetical protein
MCTVEANDGSRESFRLCHQQRDATGAHALHVDGLAHRLPVLSSDAAFACCRPQKLVLTAADVRREAAVAAARAHLARLSAAPTPAARHDSSPADIVLGLTRLGALTLSPDRDRSLNATLHVIMSLNPTGVARPSSSFLAESKETYVP